MAHSVTVGTIVDMVQILVEDPLHKLATETDYMARIQRTFARLYGIYVEAEPDRFRTEATITAITGTASYAMPLDWLTTIAVDVVASGGRRPLRRLHEEERNDYINQSGQAEAFRLLGTNVVLYPTPLTGQSYVHIYIPTAPDLDDRGDTIDCRLGHEDYIEKIVARDLLTMKREYDGRWDDDITKIEEELQRESNWRYFTDNISMMANRMRRPWPYGPEVAHPLVPRIPRG